jgi:cobalt-zinc-cadmium efflux system outer membrane protein
VTSVVCIAACCGAAPGLAAQQSLSRADAIRLALGASARVTEIGADTLAAVARLRSAREYPNPSLSASYSRSVPQNHFSVEIPIDLPLVRGPRVRAAEAGRASAGFTFLAARAAIELDVDTMYTTAQGAQFRAALSEAAAHDAAKLLSDTRARRDAGDASDLDVNLAAVSAGQAANLASVDSLEAIDTRLELQQAMGLRGDTVTVQLVDSLTASPRVSSTAVPIIERATTASSPAVRAASAALTAAQQSLILQQHSVFGLPAVQLGVEGRDPTGAEKGVLPTFGIVLPLPLFNRNGGEISAAQAEVTRARAALAIARVDASSQLARARRAQLVAESRLERDRTIMEAATRNVTMTERGFAEGQLAIGDILEARRAEREAQSQYVGDVVAANIGAAVVRVLTESGVAR